MINKRLKNVVQIVSWRLCMGCGACAAACPENNISLVDVFNQGIRPIVNSAKCRSCGECVKVCPGVEISHCPFDEQTIPGLRESWGPVLEVWEGYATDPEIRFRGSSGGVATALALLCVEKEQASGVLHVGAKPEAPLQNVPVFSKSKAELLAYTGSRYSPAAPCEKLKWIQEALSSCVFIGKPCDIVALRKSQAVNPTLRRKVSLAISIFCAGTPATIGTIKLLETLGVKPEDVDEFRYRGCGWPGVATVKLRGNDSKRYQMSYEKSWGEILSNYVALRCRLCPDGTGEFADISCGDPWYKEIDPEDPGQSLVLARTARGKQFLEKAVDYGYVKLKRVDADIVSLSQKALLMKRGSIWGRQLAFKILSVPAPHFTGFSLFANWRQLSMHGKTRSIVGALRRAICQNRTRPIPLELELKKDNY